MIRKTEEKEVRLTDQDFLDKISTLIRERRLELGLSQYDMSSLVFGHRKKHSYFSELETGKRQGMTLTTFFKIMTVLRIKIHLTPEQHIN